MLVDIHKVNLVQSIDKSDQDPGGDGDVPNRSQLQDEDTFSERTVQVVNGVVEDSEAQKKIYLSAICSEEVAPVRLHIISVDSVEGLISMQPNPLLHITGDANIHRPSEESMESKAPAIAL